MTVAWLTGSRKGKARAAMLEQVASGEAALVVGTHAVIQDEVAFARLGLAIVDEQHRFGVAQRLALRSKLVGERGPSAARAAPADDERDADPAHAGDDATSPTSTSARIDELPPGRTPIVTKLFADTEARRR